jgi:hypothetical protein
MTRRGLLNIVLLAAVLTLGAIAYLGPNDEQPPRTRLTAVDPEGVQRIEIRHRDTGTMTLVLSAGRWTLTEPLAMPAGDFAIRRLLGVLTEPVSSELEGPQTTDLAKFGLAEPRTVLRFDDTRIEFGDTNPLGSRRYVRTDEGVYLIPDTHLFALERGVYGLVSTRLLPEGARIERLTIDELQVERDGEDRWRLSPPDPTVSNEQLGALMERWSEARALRVAAADDEAEANTPGSEVSVELHDKGTLRFEVHALEPELVLIRPAAAIAYHLPATQAERLLAPPEPEHPEPSQAN